MVPDHAHPRSRGGTDEIDNLVPSCFHCNAAKGWLTLEEFRLVRALRAGNLSFAFPGEEPLPQRDWLCCHSKEYERTLVVANQPWAADAYSRTKTGRGQKRRPVVWSRTVR
jgi:hypothetical protein